MFGNLIVLVILIALVVLFGWLTYRAIRSKKMWVKIVGGILGTLATLLFAAITFGVGKGFMTVYMPPSALDANLKVEATPEQIARGKYIAQVSCAGCHDPDKTGVLVGGMDFSKEIPIPIGNMVSRNLTPAGILAERTDGELFRAIRHGVTKDGSLAGFMSFMPYRDLSDDDTKALIAYMRSQPPTPNGNDLAQGTQFNALGLLFMGAGMFPIPEARMGVITAPAPGANAEYGKYVATFGECRGCHGPNMTGAEPSAMDPVGVPNARLFTAQISHEDFVKMMRTGKRPDGSDLKMPWENAAQMNDEDLGALYEYLKSAQ
ncbi:MAG: c-type cytochrome [Anaerolineae bacterium]|nr:c-type cytochrome [Anaerolineae bacterium]